MFQRNRPQAVWHQLVLSWCTMVSEVKWRGVQERKNIDYAKQHLTPSSSSRKVQLQKHSISSGDVRTKQNINKNKKERYLGIVIPQLPGKDVKGWCISWIEGKVIPVFTSARKRHKHDSYKSVQRVGSCDLLCKMKFRWERTANGYPPGCEVCSTSQQGGIGAVFLPMLANLESWARKLHCWCDQCCQ